MKIKNMILIASLFFSSNLFATITRVYDTTKKENVEYHDFINHSTSFTYIVLGEFHNDIAIQKAEAQIILDTSKKATEAKSVSVMWEFLNFTEQQKIDQLYTQYLNDLISTETLIEETVGKQNSTYGEVYKAAKELKAKLIGLNLPRSLKQQVMAGGLSSIDQSLVPDSHYLSGQDYLDRFSAAMGGHMPAEKLGIYYLAQCLTDSVMAHHAHLNQSALNFIIAGSFHTDFFDATVEKLKNLDSKTVLSIKIVNDDNLQTKERDLYLNGDPLYGEFADYIIFTSGK